MYFFLFMSSLIECKNRNTKILVNTLEKIQKRINRMSKFYVPSLVQKVVCETYINNERNQTIEFKKKFSSKNLKKALKTLKNTIYKLKKSKSEIFPLKNTSDVFINTLNEILVNFDKMCLLVKRTYKDINYYYKVININWRYKMNKEDYFNEEKIKLEQLLMEQIEEYRNLLDGILKDLNLMIKPLKVK